MSTSLKSRALAEIGAACPVALSDAERSLTPFTDDCNPESIRVALNKCFREMLMLSSFDNMDIRILLDDNDNLEYWWYNFKHRVLPYIAQHKG